MKHLSELIGYAIKCEQPSALKMEYEFRADGELAATLRFRSSLGSFATAVSLDGIWTFNRVGLWRPHPIVRALGSETDIAVFKNNTWREGGTLELADGRKFKAKDNFWHTQFEFKTETGESLVTYQNIGGVIRSSALIEIHSQAADLAELPWMVMLGWYLILMSQQDSAAISAAV